MPPRNKVAFSADRPCAAPSVIDRTAEAGGIEPSQAAELYRSWLAEAKGDDGSIRIEGVGTITPDGKIETDKVFYNLLNPDRSAFVKITKRSSGKTVLITACSLAAVAAIAFGTLEYLGTEKPQTSPASMPETAPQTTKTAPAPDTTFSEPQSVPLIPLQPATPIDGPKFYIIAGTFSVEANADKYIGQLQKKFSSLECEKVRLSQSRWMVAIASHTDKDAAQRMLSELRYVKSDLWIYESVNRRPSL